MPNAPLCLDHFDEDRRASSSSATGFLPHQRAARRSAKISYFHPRARMSSILPAPLSFSQKLSELYPSCLHL